MEHLLEIEDAHARHGVHTYQTQMEVLVLSLLNRDRDVALVQIEDARIVSLDYVATFGSAVFAIDHDSKAERVATAMLERTFERLRIVIDSPDDDDASVDHVN